VKEKVVKKSKMRTTEKLAKPSVQPFS